MLRKLLAFYFRLRYGIRGGIKPPLNWNRAHSRWYRWRRWCWTIEDNLYTHSGLPERWATWRNTAPKLPALNHSGSRRFRAPKL